MSTSQDSEQNSDAGVSNQLSHSEKQSVDELGAEPAKVVHEVVRLKGDEELDRTITSLSFSGFAAGVAISASIIGETFLSVRLPESQWKELIVSLGYPVGFIVVILGNLQLFTETTVTAVLPLAARPTARNLKRTLRLWTVVLTANTLGTLSVAVLVAKQIIVEPDALEAALVISRPILTHDFITTALFATPAGFLIASIAWIRPNARASEFWVIAIITYVVAIGGFSHVVAGSGEAWLLWLSGETTLAGAVLGFILPAALGNIIGGSGLFAILAHAQVRDELT
jgi:formate/nitrite transporter FocA (FNT family)